MSLVLGFDQSTSATKLVLFDENGESVDKTSLSHEQLYPQPGWVEHNAEEIWQNVLQVAQELCQRNADRLGEIVAISIANQRETFVVFDRETGKPLRNAIVWQCRRGDPICEQLKSQGHEPLVRERTGLQLDTYFPASKIMWLLETEPQVAEQVRSGEAAISTIDAYLVYRMTGGKEFATDHTNASRTLLYDPRKLSWDNELCELFGVPEAALPEVRDSNAFYGESDLGGALPAPVPLCGVMGDSQASLFAQQCYEPGMGKATFGTGTSVMVNVGNQAGVELKDSVLALAWVIDGKPTYALEGIISYSTATLTWLRDQLHLIDDIADCEQIASELDGNGGVYLVPAFAGLSAPYWSSDARAAIVGMSGHTTKDHILRAALEAVSYQIRDVVDMIVKEAGIAPQQMQADGGPTCNKFLMQFTADITRLCWKVSPVAESSALGAAMAAMLGTKLHQSLEDLAKLPREGASYEPQMTEADATTLINEWHAAVQRVL